MREILHFHSPENNIVSLGCDAMHSFRYIPTFSRVISPLTTNLTIKEGSGSKLMTYIHQKTQYHTLDLQFGKKQMIYHY